MNAGLRSGLDSAGAGVGAWVRVSVAVDCFPLKWEWEWYSWWVFVPPKKIRVQGGGAILVVWWRMAKSTRCM